MWVRPIYLDALEGVLPIFFGRREYLFFWFTQPPEQLKSVKLQKKKIWWLNRTIALFRQAPRDVNGLSIESVPCFRHW